MGLPGRVIDFDVMEGHWVDDEEEKMTGNETELDSEVNGYKETELGFLLPSTLQLPLSFNDPNVRELNFVPQASGNVSPEIAKSHWAKQSPPYVKESKGNVNTSIGGRLNGFFSPKKESKDKDSGDIEETSVHANDFAYSPAQLSAQRTSARSIPLSAGEVR